MVCVNKVFEFFPSFIPHCFLFLLYNTMSDKKRQFLQLPELCRALKASGFPSNSQRDIVSGPASQLSVNTGSLYCTQVFKHITSLVNSSKIKRITGVHLRDSIEGEKMDIGCTETLLSDNLPALFN